MRIVSEHGLSMLAGALVIAATLWFVLPSGDEAVEASATRTEHASPPMLPLAPLPDDESARADDFPADPSELADSDQPALRERPALREITDPAELGIVAGSASAAADLGARVHAPSQETGGAPEQASSRAAQARGPWVEVQRFPAKTARAPVAPKPENRVAAASSPEVNTSADVPFAPPALVDDRGRPVFGKPAPAMPSDPLGPRPSGPAKSTSPALARALAAFVSGRFEEAKAGYIEVLQVDANSPAALRGLGLAAARLAQNAVARESLTRYLQVAPSAPDAAAIEARIATLTP